MRPIGQRPVPDGVRPERRAVLLFRHQHRAGVYRHGLWQLCVSTLEARDMWASREPPWPQPTKRCHAKSQQPVHLYGSLPAAGRLFCPHSFAFPAMSSWLADVLHGIFSVAPLSSKCRATHIPSHLSLPRSGTAWCLERLSYEGHATVSVFLHGWLLGTQSSFWVATSIMAFGHLAGWTLSPRWQQEMSRGSWLSRGPLLACHS